MRAAILQAIGQPLILGESPTPVVEAHEVLIKIAACGVCHSDYHLVKGEWEQLKPITKIPLIPGHEITGTISEVGANVTSLQVGDRVGVPWLYYTCGECDYCKNGQETLCPKQKITGCMVDGGFAEFINVPATHAAKLPDNLSFEEAAPLLCAGVTIYKAMRVAEARAGQRLVVFGIGGLGHLAVQLGKALGLEVGAVDVSDEKILLAKDCGADWGVNVTTEIPHKAIKSHGGGADIALVTSGSSAAYDTALRALKRAGTLVIVGMTPNPISLSTVAMVSGEYKIVASAVGTRKDLAATLQLASEGKLRCHYETRPLTEVNEVLQAMGEGKLVGRVVLKI